MSFGSSAVPSLQNALGVSSTRIPIDRTTFVSYVLPPLVCYFIAALLAVMPQTRAARVALWPLVAWFALRAAVSVDFSLGKAEQNFVNSNFVLLMLSVTTRTLDWTLAKGPLVRHLRPANSSPSTIMDALDLASNFRGHGWNWSRYRSYIPRETRPTNRMAFVIYALLSAAMHALICGAFQRAVLALIPVGVGANAVGSTIFDDTLPFPVRFLRAGVISALATMGIYGALQMAYDMSTVFGIVLLGQDPAQWPPAFDAPWFATSLRDFWGHRWHQFFRHIFMLLGGYPLSVVLGRAGLVIGTFLASVLWHHLAVITINGKVDVWWMLVGFGMMSVGIIIEEVFQQLTRRRVGGVLGWVWTMAWLLVWGNVIVEGLAKGGLFSSSSFFDSSSPLRGPAERLAKSFDVWLHAI